MEWGIVGTDSAKAYYFRGLAVDRCAEAEHYAEKGELWAGEAFLAQTADVVPSPADRAGMFAQIRAVQPFDLPPLRGEPEPLSEAVVIRFYNPTEKTLEGEIHSYRKIQRAERVTLEEVTEEKVSVQGGGHQVKITVRSKQIQSYMLYF